LRTPVHLPHSPRAWLSPAVGHRRPLSQSRSRNRQRTETGESAQGILLRHRRHNCSWTVTWRLSLSLSMLKKFLNCLIKLLHPPHLRPHPHHRSSRICLALPPAPLPPSPAAPETPGSAWHSHPPHFRPHPLPPKLPDLPGIPTRLTSALTRCHRSSRTCLSGTPDDPPPSPAPPEAPGHACLARRTIPRPHRLPPKLQDLPVWHAGRPSALTGSPRNSRTCLSGSHRRTPLLPRPLPAHQHLSRHHSRLCPASPDANTSVAILRALARLSAPASPDADAHATLRALHPISALASPGGDARSPPRLQPLALTSPPAWPTPRSPPSRLSPSLLLRGRRLRIPPSRLQLLSLLSPPAAESPRPRTAGKRAEGPALGPARLRENCPAAR
jgi:hypothetical protein